MRRGDGRGRILIQRCLELRVIEGGPELSDGFPNGVIHQDRAAGDAAVQLRGNVTRLPFHLGGILRPGFEQSWNIGFGYLEDIDENDG